MDRTGDREVPGSTGSREAEPGATAGWVRAPRLGLRGPFLALAAVSFVVSLGIFVVAPLLPLFAVALSATPLQLALLTGGFAVASAAGQLLVGLGVERAGTRAFILGGVGVYGLARVLVGVAGDITTLILFRALSGLGQGGFVVAARLYLAQVADQGRLTFANGALFAAQSAGSVAGPAVGGLLSEWQGIRAPFLFVGALGVAGLAASLRLPRPAPAEPRAVASAGEAAPALTRPVLTLLFAQVTYMLWHGIITTVFPLFATSRLGWTPVEIGFTFSIYALGSILLGPWLSHAADRYGRVRITQLCCLPLAVWTVAISLALPWPVILATTLATGGGNTAALSAMMALLTAASPERARGRTFGLVSAAGQLGLAAGALLSAAIWQTVDITAALLSSNLALLLAGAALALLPRPVSTPAARLAPADV